MEICANIVGEAQIQVQPLTARLNMIQFETTHKYNSRDFRVELRPNGATTVCYFWAGVSTLDDLHRGGTRVRARSTHILNRGN